MDDFPNFYNDNRLTDSLYLAGSVSHFDENRTSCLTTAGATWYIHHENFDNLAYLFRAGIYSVERITSGDGECEYFSELRYK